jgi:hypothetical protein
MSPTAVLNLHIKRYVPYCSVKPPHTGLCTPIVGNITLYVEFNTAVGDITLYVEE